MIEMQPDKKGRGYTNQLPRYAHVLHIFLIVVFLLLSLVLGSLTIYFLVHREWALTVFFIFITLLITCLAYFLILNYRQYTAFRLTYDLDDEGFILTSITKQKEETVRIPYEDIKEVLVGLDFRVIPRAHSSAFAKTLYSVGAKLIISYGNREAPRYFIFTHFDKERLLSWLETLQENKVPIAISKLNLSKAVTEEEFSEIVAEAPKVEFRPYLLLKEQMGYEPGSITHQYEPAFLTTSIIKRQKLTNKTRDVRLMWVYISLLLFNFLYSLFLLPNAAITEDGFIDDGYLPIVLVNTLCLIFGFYFWRGVKWYRSLLDSALITAVSFLGLSLSSIIISPIRGSIYTAIGQELSVFVFMLNLLFIFIRILMLIIRRRVAPDNRMM